MESHEEQDAALQIHARHFVSALACVKPSVSEMDVAAYEHMKSSIRKRRSHVQP